MKQACFATSLCAQSKHSQDMSSEEWSSNKRIWCEAGCFAVCFTNLEQFASTLAMKTAKEMHLFAQARAKLKETLLEDARAWDKSAALDENFDTAHECETEENEFPANCNDGMVWNGSDGDNDNSLPSDEDDSIQTENNSGQDDDASPGALRMSLRKLLPALPNSVGPLMIACP
jgi:hypothetical protein